jgi:hypothetical protein
MFINGCIRPMTVDCTTCSLLARKSYIRCVTDAMSLQAVEGDSLSCLENTAPINLLTMSNVRCPVIKEITQHLRCSYMHREVI